MFNLIRGLSRSSRLIATVPRIARRTFANNVDDITLESKCMQQIYGEVMKTAAKHADFAKKEHCTQKISETVLEAIAKYNRDEELAQTDEQFRNIANDLKKISDEINATIEDKCIQRIHNKLLETILEHNRTGYLAQAAEDGYTWVELLHQFEIGEFLPGRYRYDSVKYMDMCFAKHKELHGFKLSIQEKEDSKVCMWKFKVFVIEW